MPVKKRGIFSPWKANAHLKLHAHTHQNPEKNWLLCSRCPRACPMAILLVGNASLHSHSLLSDVLVYATILLLDRSCFVIIAFDIRRCSAWASTMITQKHFPTEAKQKNKRYHKRKRKPSRTRAAGASGSAIDRANELATPHTIDNRTACQNPTTGFRLSNGFRDAPSHEGTPFFCRSCFPAGPISMGRRERTSARAASRRTWTKQNQWRPQGCQGSKNKNESNPHFFCENQDRGMGGYNKF